MFYREGFLTDEKGMVVVKLFPGIYSLRADFTYISSMRNDALFTILKIQ